MSVTAASGFLAYGLAAGLKSSGSKDLALVINTGPDYAAAGVFTTNRVKAAPVVWSEQVLTDGQLRAVILNSGGANACTGPAGFADTHRTAELLADALRQAQGTAGLAQTAGRHRIGAIDVAVCSTGLIGVRLPMDKVAAGINDLVPLVRRRRRTGGGRSNHDNRFGDEAGELLRRGLVDRWHGKGRGHARTRIGHDAGGTDDRRCRGSGAAS